MTNLQSIAGGALWIVIATLLMLATFEPVAIEQAPAPAFVLAAAATTGSAAA
jgi:hypothetical protein